MTRNSAVRSVGPELENQMKIPRTCLGGLAVAFLATPTWADGVSQEILNSLTTPDKVKSKLGALGFRDGAPDAATLAKVYDNLDFTHALNAFLDTMQGVSIEAIMKGFESIGMKDNDLPLSSPTSWMRSRCF